ncbi:O-antigen ligase family protein [Bradyrhizobium sp.]|uniref:O-antigen ligase family protein n=1 Tax=Bradyrhizobium sp. TaxID=376 RepID=UPI00271CBBA7|nr:O-antigen ligase family protein [Bradyrhizobium sp.]MDO9298609.1 O-antigen ligase family protein [Bradyrhizobium sp.]
MSLPLGKPASAMLNGMSRDALRQAMFGVAFAILIAPNSVLVLGFGMTGSPGNSPVTGAVLMLATMAVGLLCLRRDIALLPADYLFLAFVVCIASSSVINGWTTDAKEYQLLLLSLAAYPACRLISRADMLAGRSSFILVIGIIALLGTIAMTNALLRQWDSVDWRPLVFGFNAAGTYFLGTLSIFVIALVTTGELTTRRTFLISALIFLPMIVFTASLVRFTFIALAGALCMAAILSEAKQRKHVVAIALVILVAVAAGMFSRSDKAKQSLVFAMERPTVVELPSGNNGLAGKAGSSGSLKSSGSLEPSRSLESSDSVEPRMAPSCYLKVSPLNSILIRKVLIQDAVFLIPGSGWFGTGLDTFMESSCIKRTQAHNSILQAAVEFGWLGGALLFLVVAVAAGSLLPLARYDNASRFVLCSLAYVVLISLAHGRLSRDGVLFAFLGAAVGLRETFRAQPASAVSPALA